MTSKVFVSHSGTTYVPTDADMERGAKIKAALEALPPEERQRIRELPWGESLAAMDALVPESNEPLSQSNRT